MDIKYKNCQSCGMPLTRDGKALGTDADGKISEIYCGYCYKNGEFTLPNITVSEMKDRVNSKLLEMHFPKILAKFFSRNIHKLKRWK
ncbi:MAG TPA: zinc ribbon domain-containing protein [Clostridiaceae bacterium]